MPKVTLIVSAKPWLQSMFVGLKYLKNAVLSPLKPVSKAKYKYQNTKMTFSLWLERKRLKYVFLKKISKEGCKEIHWGKQRKRGNQRLRTWLGPGLQGGRKGGRWEGGSEWVSE